MVKSDETAGASRPYTMRQAPLFTDRITDVNPTKDTSSYCRSAAKADHSFVVILGGSSEF